MRANLRRGEMARMVCGVAMAVACIGAQTGCRPASAEREKRELVLWANPTGVEEEAFARICRRFEAEHPGIMIRMTGGVGAERLTRAIVADAPPDLCYLYGPSTVAQYAANSAILPLDNYFRRSGLRDSDFLPGAIDQGRYRGQLYAMPMTRDSRALYWNRKSFRAAGLAPDKPPRTIEEMTALAVRLTRKSSDGSLIQIGLLPPYDDPALTFALFGGEAIDPRTGRITATNPRNIAALKWLVALVDAEGGREAVGGFTSGFASDTSSQNPLATGKIAMRIDGEYAAMHLDRYAPGTDYAIGEIPHPAAHPELTDLAWGDGDILVIPTGSRHPDLAWEFVRWMQLPPQQFEYARAMSNLPTLVSLGNDPKFSAGSHSMRLLGYVLKHIASNRNNARFVPASPIVDYYANALKDAFDLALYHEKTPEQALADVQTRIERELRRYE